MRTKSPSENIPNLDNLYEVTRDFVKEHQGDKGYIDTSNADGAADYIYGIFYDFYLDNCEEKIIVKVRVDEANDLQVMPQDSSEWISVRYGDVAYYVQTIFKIAEFIEEYVD